MQKVDVLFVGTATDGPTEELIPVDSLERMLRLFGAYHYERVTITSGATGHTLSFVPWGGEVMPLHEDGNGFLVPKYLYEFSVAGSGLTWTSMGTGSTVIFRGMRVPGGTDLLKALWASQNVDTRIHLLRLGGSHAEATSGEYSFTARYAGSRYNGTTLTITGGVVEIRPAVGTGRNWVYRPVSDLALKQALLDDVARGHQSVYMTGFAARDRFSIPSGVYTLSGGTDGSLTADSFKTFLEEYDLQGVEVVCPVGLSTTVLSGAGCLDSLAQSDYPTLLVAQAPIAASGVMLSGFVNTSRYLCSVAFRTNYDFGANREWLEDAAPMVAAIIGGRRFGITLHPVPENPPNPRFDQAAIHALAAARHTVSTFSISKGWALWHALTGDENWTVSTFRSYQEVVRPLHEVLEPLLGKGSARLQGVREQVDQRLAAVRSSRVLHWDLALDGDVVYVDLWFQPYGEVQIIRARVALGQPDNPDIV